LNPARLKLLFLVPAIAGLPLPSSSLELPVFLRRNHAIARVRFETKRPRLKNLSATRQNPEADACRKPGRRFDDSSAFTARNGLFASFDAAFSVLASRMFVRRQWQRSNALTLLAESVCDGVPCMTVRRRNDETSFLSRFIGKITISNSKTSLTRQGFVTLRDFRSRSLT
jgi:hypothetical protein